MDGDFQQNYQAAERAYGEGDYQEAKRIATELLAQLRDTSQDPDMQAAVLGWRAFVALLLGHIELYGLENASAASGYYRMVLDSQPHETLAELAQQGLMAIFRGRRFDRSEALSRRGLKMKTSLIILGCLIVGGILGFSATQSDIDFITADWIYGSIVGSFLLSGWVMNYQRGELMTEINELKDRIIELELASKEQ